MPGGWSPERQASSSGAEARKLAALDRREGWAPGLRQGREGSTNHAVGARTGGIRQGLCSLPNGPLAHRVLSCSLVRLRRPTPRRRGVREFNLPPLRLGFPRLKGACPEQPLSVFSRIPFSTRRSDAPSTRGHFGLVVKRFPRGPGKKTLVAEYAISTGPWPTARRLFYTRPAEEPSQPENCAEFPRAVRCDSKSADSGMLSTKREGSASVWFVFDHRRSFPATCFTRRWIAGRRPPSPMWRSVVLE